ncbi:MAG: J domain-containing protein [Nitrospirae bacterium]|nr:MAG: J domain-containing protein [Nitrospirota bacterium]
MVHRDYYDTLGVTPQASDEEIKKAYRKLVLQFHPDRNQGSREAEARIREINAAYEILGDPEARKSYERLRFGLAGPRASAGYESEPEETLSPQAVLEAMETKLRDEARKELFAVLMQQFAVLKEELAVIRERTVARQGYDAFREEIVRERAREVLGRFVSPEMESRRQRLLDVALRMMLTQGVAGTGEASRLEWVKRQLQDAYYRGWIDGYAEACALLYVRR